jgi:threonine synthase
MKPGDTILILPSVSLTNLRLEALVGLNATIVEINGNFDDIKGCWVELPGTYLGEREWYIPYNSIGI